jgi:hypothetical protein
VKTGVSKRATASIFRWPLRKFHQNYGTGNLKTGCIINLFIYLCFHMKVNKLKNMMFSIIFFSFGSTTSLERKLQMLGKCCPYALNNLFLYSLKKAETYSWFSESTILT